MSQKDKSGVNRIKIRLRDNPKIVTRHPFHSDLALRIDI